MSKVKSKKGFTIIEVVLVLAIAGLIFLMVFIALPAMQRSQRDTQRRDQLSGMMTQITQYQANNRNKLPSDAAQSDVTPDSSGKVDSDTSGWGQFYKNYLLAQGDTFEDPNGNPYKLTFLTCDSAKCPSTGSLPADFAEQDYKVSIVYNAKCNGEQTEYNSGSRKIAIVYKLEGGGTYCTNN